MELRTACSEKRLEHPPPGKAKALTHRSLNSISSLIVEEIEIQEGKTCSQVFSPSPSPAPRPQAAFWQGQLPGPSACVAVQGLCSEGPQAWLTLCCHHLEFLIIWNKGTMYHFAVGPASCGSRSCPSPPLPTVFWWRKKHWTSKLFLATSWGRDFGYCS